MKNKKLVFFLFVFASARVFAGYPVTVIGNVDPGELVHRAAEIAKLAAQLQQAEQMVQQASTLVKFAGDPKAAVNNFSDLSRISNSLANIVGEGGTADALHQIAATANAAQGVQNAQQQSDNAFNGLKNSVANFGKPNGSTPNLFEALHAAEGLSAAARAQLQTQTDTRKAIADELVKADAAFKSATTESEKQAAATRIAQLQAKAAVLDGQRDTMLADIALEDRQKKEAADRQAALYDTKEDIKGGMVAANQAAQSTRMTTATQQAVGRTKAASFDMNNINSAWFSAK